MSPGERAAISRALTVALDAHADLLAGNQDPQAITHARRSLAGIAQGLKQLLDDDQTTNKKAPVTAGAMD